MRTHADYAFARLLSDLLTAPSVTTRNAPAHKLFAPDPITFTSLPLITVRPVAASKALREMEWFMSGQAECPEQLLDWWNGQLGEDNFYEDGYPWQLRLSSNSCKPAGIGEFDQITHVIESIRNHPQSRRHIITAWNPGEMANITETNGNPNTPTTCHLTMVQFSVTHDGALDMYSYQRSADVLLGLPHNWIQHWSLLVWLAHHTGLIVGRMKWQGGDVHLYDEPTHLQCAEEIAMMIGPERFSKGCPDLIYIPSTPTDSVQAIADGYRGADFRIAWPDGQSKMEPLSTVRPRLL